MENVSASALLQRNPLGVMWLGAVSQSNATPMNFCRNHENVAVKSDLIDFLPEISLSGPVLAAE
jgi:hypothetical protein